MHELLAETLSDEIFLHFLCLDISHQDQLLHGIERDFKSLYICISVINDTFLPKLLPVSSAYLRFIQFLICIFSFIIKVNLLFDAVFYQLSLFIIKIDFKGIKRSTEFHRILLYPIPVESLSQSFSIRTKNSCAISQQSGKDKYFVIQLAPSNL